MADHHYALGRGCDCFRASNEALNDLYLWPFDGMLTVPIWLVVTSSFIIGGLFSICLMWAQALAIRARLWNLQGKFNRLETVDQACNEVLQDSDKQADGGLTVNYTPEPNIKIKKPNFYLNHDELTIYCVEQ